MKSESELARVLDIHPSSVGAAKKREQIPPGWIEKVAEHYGINAHWLFFGKGEKYFLGSEQRSKSVLDSPNDEKSNAEKLNDEKLNDEKSRDELILARIIDQPPFLPAMPDGKSLSASGCPQCQYLRTLLSQEQAERRELSQENRKLWAKLCHLESEHARLLAFADSKHKKSDSAGTEQVA